MKIKKQISSSLLTPLLLGLAVAANATPTTYVWASHDGDPDGIAGTIVLDTSSSASGSVSDIVSMTFSDKLDTFSVLISPFVIKNYSANDSDGRFDWSPSGINDMDLQEAQTFGLHTLIAAEFEQPGPVVNGGNELMLGDLPNGKVIDDEDGSWVAASTVPDASSSSMLLLFSAALLVAVRHTGIARVPALAVAAGKQGRP